MSYTSSYNAYKSLIIRILAATICLTASCCAYAWELADKNVALLGDSNTWIGGEDCSQPRGWNYWFAMEAKPGGIRSYARSGATWTHTSATQPDVNEYSEVLGDNNVVFNQILRLYADVDINGRPAPDIIIVAAGTNDAWFADRRPEEFSKTVAEAFAREEWEYGAALPSAFRSLAESIRYDLTTLHGFFPQAEIVVLTPIPSIKISAEMLGKVSDIIADASERMDCKVIRMDWLSPIRPDSETVNRRFTTDGTHTSEEGAHRHGEIVARAIAGMQ